MAVPMRLPWFGRSHTGTGAEPGALRGGAAPAAVPATRPDGTVWSTGQVRWLLVAVAVAVIGAASGGVWHLAAKPEVYTVGADGGAQISEWALSRVFAMDAWFIVIALLGGMGLGTLVWKLVGSLGWPAAVVALLGGLAAGIVCWQVGEAFGPHDFATRLAQAVAGERVPMDFALRAKSALLMWPVGALLPVLVYAVFGSAMSYRSRRPATARPPAEAPSPDGGA